jgi:hypothetical protein
MEPEQDDEEQCQPLAPAVAEHGHQQHYQYLGRSSSVLAAAGGVGQEGRR